MVHTRDEVIRVMTENYLNSLDMANLPAPDVIQENILATVETALKMENSMRDKGDKFSYVHELLPAQIATILIRLYPIVKISSTVKGVTDYDLLYEGQSFRFHPGPQQLHVRCPRYYQQLAGVAGDKAARNDPHGKQDERAGTVD